MLHERIVYGCAFETEIGRKREVAGGKSQESIIIMHGGNNLIGPQLRIARYDKEERKDTPYQELLVSDSLRADPDFHVMSKLLQTVELSLGFLATISQSRDLHDVILISGKIARHLPSGRLGMGRPLPRIHVRRAEFRLSPKLLRPAVPAAAGFSFLLTTRNRA